MKYLDKIRILTDKYEKDGVKKAQSEQLLCRKYAQGHSR